MQKRISGATLLAATIFLVALDTPALSQTVAGAASDEPAAIGGSAESTARSQGRAETGEVLLLKKQVELQEKQLEQLRAAVNELKQRLDRVAQGNPQSAATQMPSLGQIASLAPIVPSSLKAAVATAPALKPMPDPGPAPAAQEQTQGYVQKVDSLGKTVDVLSNGLAGFKFGGDFRYRFDAIARASSSVGGPQQNVRERYRLRFNGDKALSSQLDAHFQLGSGTFNNPLTFDTDFAGANNRGPLFITEFWGAYHPNKNVDVRAGKMPEVFADNSRFFYDDDLRLNGFQETGRTLFEKNGIGLKSIEFRAGQYILTNPNVQVLPSAAACTAPPAQVITTLPATITALPTLPAACAYLSAGFLPGQKVRDTNLFDQGVALIGDIKEEWSHQLNVNVQLWRNQNGLQLASLTSGFPILVNGYYGAQVSGGPPGTGTATTTKGGAIFTAHAFQVERINYRITHVGWKTARQGFPAWLDLQASRNFGVGFANNAWMGTVSVGEVKKFGDLRFLYQYGVKDANSMIAQVTDDDFGTGTGVNLRTHGIRLDLGLNKFLEWDNKLWIQDPVRGNDLARNLFVPVPTGVNTSYRIQSEFNVKF